MKKIFQNTLVRGLCILALGILLVVFSGDVSLWMVIASGAIFIIMGALALINYFRRKSENRQVFLYPVLAGACVAFGLVQVVFPELFFEVLRYLLAGLAFLLAVIQLYGLFDIRRGGVPVKWFYFLLPLVGVGLSLFVCFYQNFEERDPLVMQLLGIGFIIYGVLELWTLVLLRKPIVPKEDNLPEVRS